MKCCLCNKVALRQAGKKGFCADHVKEAYAEAKRIKEANASKFAVDCYFKFERAHGQ